MRYSQKLTIRFLILLVITFWLFGFSLLPSKTSTQAQAIISNPLPGWTQINDLKTERAGHFSVLLQNGKVLICGGENDSNYRVGLTSAELYDPTTGIFTPTGSMTQIHPSGTATLLPNGKVLVSGGRLNNNTPTIASSELYDPETGLFTPTGDLQTPRFLHTATLLQNGKVLITGGNRDFNGPGLNTAELYDPETGKFTTTGNMTYGRVSHSATLLLSGKVLITGGNTITRAEIYDPINSNFSLTGAMTTNRVYAFATTLLKDGRVLIAGGSDGINTGVVGQNTAEIFDPINGLFTATSVMSDIYVGRSAILLNNGKVLLVGYQDDASLFDPLADAGKGAWYVTAHLRFSQSDAGVTLLQDGQVLVTGGLNVDSGDFIKSAELYNPATSNWLNVSGLKVGRVDHSATLLQNGKVLLAGGSNSNGILVSAELYDPASGTSKYTGNLSIGRKGHSATLLRNGNVLIVGGRTGSGDGTPSLSAEIYNPLTGLFSPTGNLVTARYNPASLLLPDGKVLVVGGENASGQALASTELYDPSSGTFSATGNLAVPRANLAVTLLRDGRVLTTGGKSNDSELALKSTEIFDLTGNNGQGGWAFSGDMKTAREAHSALLLADGKVLVTGGASDSTLFGSLNSTELYDPQTGSFSPIGNMLTPRHSHTATLLPNSKVLLAGGHGPNNTALAASELYDPQSQTFSQASDMLTARENQRAVILPEGRVFMSGGKNLSSAALSNAEIFDYAFSHFEPGPNSLLSSYKRSAILLPSGKVLLAGGYATFQYPTPIAITEIYDPLTNSMRRTTDLGVARAEANAVLLPNGKVLLAGGATTTPGGPTNSAEIFDPGTETWSPTMSMSTYRAGATGTLLPNGKVLIAGGEDKTNYLSGAELYDPLSQTWSPTGSMSVPRQDFVATLLPSGKVLVAGGKVNFYTLTTSVELYDPATGIFTPTGNLNSEHANPTATLLPNGKVLLVGTGSYDAELYDSATGTWTPTSPMLFHPSGQSSTLLPDGKVLVAGSVYKSSIALYDPETDLWLPGYNMSTYRYFHTATLLPNGKVLMAEGLGGANTSEIFDQGSGFPPNAVPQISEASSPLLWNTALNLTGSGFQGVSETSGGSNSYSASNYPLVQLQSLSSGQTQWLPAAEQTNWSDSTFTSIPLANFQPGYTLVTVFTNGIHSQAKIIKVENYSLSLTSFPTPAFLGQAVTFTATILSMKGYPPGSINFEIDGNLFGSDQINSQGMATFTTSNLSLGVHSIKAYYSGDSNFAAVTSPVLKQQVLCSYEVTNDTDDGSGTQCGTLSYALKQGAVSTVPVTITLPAHITITGPLPVVTTTNHMLLTISGGCISDLAGRGIPGSSLIAGPGAGITGLTLNENIILDGVKISGFAGYELEIAGNNNLVTCSWFGTTDGTTSTGLGGGIDLRGSNNQLGLTNDNLKSGNLISGNANIGLLVETGAKNNHLFNNWFGLNATGLAKLPNRGGAMHVLAGGEITFGVGNRTIN